MRRSLLLIAALATVMMTAATVEAKQDSMCEDAGLSRDAVGLCLAYCDKLDCLSAPRGRDKICNSLHAKFEERTGLTEFPCEAPPDDPTGEEPAPCVDCPQPCDGGNDPLTGSPWVVCDADEHSAWVSHADPAGGVFSPEEVCQQLGYAGVSQIGGTCGSVCGNCDGGTSCDSPGTRFFDGNNACGYPYACFTTMWECWR